MTAVAGIDVSSFAIDVVILDDDTDEAAWFRYLMVGANPFLRARDLPTVFPKHSWWDDHGVWLIGIEDPHSRQSHTAKALGLATGAVAALLPLDLTIIQTPPSEWKRLYTGKSNASKDHIRCVSEWYPDWPQDAYDALGIATAVRTLNNNAIAAA